MGSILQIWSDIIFVFTEQLSQCILISKHFLIVHTKTSPWPSYGTRVKCKMHIFGVLDFAIQLHISFDATNTSKIKFEFFISPVYLV